MCWRAIDRGASGVDMGRNIFQSSAPRDAEGGEKGGA